MAKIVSFSRSRNTSIQRKDRNTIISSCRLSDTLTEAFVQIEVVTPDLAITKVKAEFIRSEKGEYKKDFKDELEKLKGVRIGSGMLKIIKGLVGDGSDFRELIFMVEECCHGVILNFTKGNLLKAPKEPEENRLFYWNMVKNNPRLLNRCAAFAPGTSITEGIEEGSDA